MKRGGRLGRVLVVGAVAGGLWLLGRGACGGTPVTLATFNIRMFPEATTDRTRLAELLAGLDADVVAVQEIRDEGALRDVLRRASRAAKRDLRLALAPCGGASGLATGVVFDAKRLRLVETRQYRELDPDDRGGCSLGHRAALLAVLEGRGRRVAVLSVHLLFGAEPEQRAVRRRQWQQAVTILKDVAGRYQADAIALGDFNSLGYRDNLGGERDFIERTVKKAKLELVTAKVPCTAYWRPDPDGGGYVPSTLDHIVATSGSFRRLEPRGMCEALACRPAEGRDPPRDYRTVSDHCPVRVVRR
ncbi:MAG TPA: endonuclease/exonuclease/phosphatase family protein [Polyangia bacterium]|jgi:endonuclease/exonuclease/phosphatase family metal-dependent hydrolase